MGPASRWPRYFAAATRARPDLRATVTLGDARARPAGAGRDARQGEPERADARAAHATGGRATLRQARAAARCTTRAARVRGAASCRRCPSERGFFVERELRAHRPCSSSRAATLTGEPSNARRGGRLRARAPARGRARRAALRADRRSAAGGPRAGRPELATESRGAGSALGPRRRRTTIASCATTAPCSPSTPAAGSLPLHVPGARQHARAASSRRRRECRRDVPPGDLQGLTARASWCGAMSPLPSLGTGRVAAVRCVAARC